MCKRRFGGLAVLLLVLAGTASATEITEDDVKLALSFKIARFVTWPESDARQEFELCIAGDSSYQTAKARLTGRKIGERSISLTQVTERPDAELCDAIYITRSEAKRAQVYLPALYTAPVLIISDIPDFAENGGMVELSMRNKRIAMTINVDAYRQAGLEFSSQLLELADLVDMQEEAEE